MTPIAIKSPKSYDKIIHSFNNLVQIGRLVDWCVGIFSTIMLRPYHDVVFSNHSVARQCELL